MYDELTEEEKHYTHLAKPEYKTYEFRINHRQVLFDFLAPFATDYINTNSFKPTPLASQKISTKYFSGCDNLFGWFCDNYETREDTQTSLIGLDEVYNVFKGGDFYGALSKSDKRLYTKSYFYDEFSKNIFLKKIVLERNSHFNGVKISKPSIVKWVRIVKETQQEI